MDVEFLKEDELIVALLPLLGDKLDLKRVLVLVGWWLSLAFVAYAVSACEEFIDYGIFSLLFVFDSYSIDFILFHYFSIDGVIVFRDIS